MAHGYRNIQAEQTYHITQRGTNQQQVFFEPADYTSYLRLIKKNLSTAGVKILAYCLMPNHVHLIVRPDFDDSLRLFFRRVHGDYARYINLKEGRTGHLWQGRYFSCALSNDHLPRALRYVEHNPVRAHLADRPESFPWSSAAAHLGAPDHSEILDLAFWNAQGGADYWKFLLATNEELLLERALRASTYSGHPFTGSTLNRKLIYSEDASMAARATSH